MRYVKKVFWAVLGFIAWSLSGLTASRRPTSYDDANARYGLDTLDSMGERMGRAGPRPGERLPPSD